MRDEIANHNPDAIVYDPKELDAAILGVSHCGKVVYSYTKLVELFKGVNDWTDEESVDWIQYNVVGAYLGEFNPIIVYDLLHD